jgi:transposase-like protein
LYPRISHHICSFHKANDIGQHLVQKRHRRRIISDALYVFKGETEIEVRKRLQLFCDRWSLLEPKAVRNFVRGLENCLVYLLYPDPLRTMLKTNNLIERQLQELRRRTIPIWSFNNSRSIKRIIYGLIAYVINQPQDMPQIQFTQLS